MVYNGEANQIGKLIKTRMIEDNWSQKELAEKTGLSRSMINSIVCGRTKNVPLTSLLVICDTLDCELLIDIEFRKDHKPRD